MRYAVTPERTQMRNDVTTPGAVSLLIAVLCCSVLAACTTKVERSELMIGDQTPRIMLPDASGVQVTIPDDLKGKAVVIHFWADWCPHCTKEMPVLDLLFNQYRDRGLIVVGVNVKQTPEIVQAYAKRLRLSFPLLLDAEGKTAFRYDVRVLPRTFFIDRQGNIRYKLHGEAAEEDLRSLILKTLQGTI